MIDLHCHILPRVDDGAKDLEESLEMARLAVSEGITHILATPHHQNKMWMNDKQKVQTLVSELQVALNEQNIPLTVFPGQEVRLYGELLKDIKEGTIQFIDEGNQYLLLEFPTSQVPAYTERLFFQLESKGVTPIIVHPERNRVFLKEPERLKELVDKGALAQLTAASYTGGFGKEIQKFSKQLIEANLVHFIASDAHNTQNRSFHMQEAMQLLKKEYGQQTVDQYNQLTKDIVNGEWAYPQPAQSIRKKKRFGLF
ncbi:tyrosine-protein phosphatase [Lacticigenium naphthae]|uniref:tyrosine-protein phosphatase n=1 Tax=Lacticigenium naphthae TaxID=515351 RepID=UPI000422E21C|nr:CpsB/CapC family capsule biosynthesis tyrosine phosphatase [Lacticigenium naphthae]